MKELMIIRRVLGAFELQKPIGKRFQKKIYRSKKRTLHDILENVRGSDAGKTGRFEFSPHAPKKTGGTMKKTFLVAAAAFAVVIIGAGIFFALNKPVKNIQQIVENKIESASVTFIIGDAQIKHANKDFTALVQGDKLLQNDVIRTGKQSSVIVQVGNLGVMRILENSEFTFGKLKENGSTEVTLSQGGVYSKIKKLEKDNSYSVKTPTAIAAVRGTQFLAQYKLSPNGKSEIQVLEGKVAVTTDGNLADEKIAEDGKGVNSVNGKLNGYKLSKIEKLTLQKYAVYGYVDDLESKNANDLKTIQDANEQKEKELDIQLNKLIAQEAKADPLDKLREQGKPLTMIHLRDGSQIAGSIVSADEKTMLLDTGDGVIKLPVAEILRRLPLK